MTLNDQGIEAAKRGDYVSARKLLEQAVTAEPDRPAAYFNLAHVYLRMGDIAGAERASRIAVCLAPDDPDQHLVLAQALIAQRRGREALVSAGHAARLAPQRSDVLRTLADLLQRMEQYAGATEIFERYLAQNPRDGAALNDLGNLYQRLGRADDADQTYAKAIEVDPSNSTALANRARFHGDRGDVEQARELYTQANRQGATAQMLLAAATTLPVIYDSVEHVQQERLRLLEEFSKLERSGVRIDPTRTVLPNMFYIAYQGENDREVMSQFAKLLVPTAQRGVQLPEPKPSGQKRLRLGVLSKYLCDHTIGHLNLGLIERLPKDKFEVFLLKLSGPNDAIAQRYAAAADHVIPIPEDVPTALTTIAAARLDTLFFPDVGMDPFTFTLAASRLAPYQVTTWGHPDTTGLVTMDAFLSVVHELPEADQHFTERLIRLPCLGVGLERPPTPPPAKREQFGLPDKATLYGCPQSLFKFHPRFDEVLCGILQRDPLARIVLIEGNHAGWTERLKRRFEQSGVGFQPARAGWKPTPLVWLKRFPREQFRQLVTLCDVMLDPTEFGGGHTSYEAFAYGVPVVTLPSQYLRGRLTLSQLRQMDLDAELAVSSIDEYVTRAVTLANDHPARARLSSALIDRSRVLFDPESAVAAVSEALSARPG
jgi:predicted O-linked N-acetylglucosamine transferase (SPINDLY family)